MHLQFIHTIRVNKAAMVERIAEIILVAVAVGIEVATFPDDSG